MLTCLHVYARMWTMALVAWKTGPQRISRSLRRAINTQTEIQKGTERMDQFKIQMNWNQEELEQWAVASRQKEEDNAVLEKVTIRGHKGRNIS